MTDQHYEDREDEGEDRDAARGRTEREEKGKACDPDAPEPDVGEPESLPDFRAA
jgi:hypothetical protein